MPRRSGRPAPCWPRCSSRARAWRAPILRGLLGEVRSVELREGHLALAEAEQVDVRGHQRSCDRRADVCGGADPQPAGFVQLLRADHAGYRGQKRPGPVEMCRGHGDVHLVCGGVAGEVGTAALRTDSAVDEDGDAVAGLLDLLQHVGAEQHRCPAVVGESPDEAQNLLDAGRVDSDGGLVEHDNIGVPDERVGDAQSLAHAAGVGAGRPVGSVGQADVAEEIADAVLGLRRIEPVEPCGVAEVLTAGHRLVEPDVVGQVADPPLDGERFDSRVEVQHTDRAAVAFGEAEEHQDGRRLPSAVGT